MKDSELMAPAIPTVPADCSLTAQQLRVLRLLAEGLSYAQIAERLDCGTSTVRTHLHDAYQRLGVGTSYQAVLVCVRAGWLGFEHEDNAHRDHMFRVEALLGRLVEAHASRRRFRTITPAQRDYLAALDVYLTDRRGADRRRIASERMRDALGGVLAEAGIPAREPNPHPLRDLVDDLLSLTERAAEAA